MIDQIWHFKNLQIQFKKEQITFNYGKHKRDFTYIDDIVEDYQILDKPALPNPN